MSDVCFETYVHSKLSQLGSLIIVKRKSEKNPDTGETRREINKFLDKYLKPVSQSFDYQTD